jgi:hypothetical protein
MLHDTHSFIIADLGKMNNIYYSMAADLEPIRTGSIHLTTANWKDYLGKRESVFYTDKKASLLVFANCDEFS